MDAASAERDRFVKEFKKTLKDTGLVVPMATPNLFSAPVFKGDVFTAKLKFDNA